MKAFLCLILGYLIGCFNPAALISKIKHVNLKQEGTKNLGATNTTLVLGKKAGILVLVTDIFKSILSYRLARSLFPQLMLAGLIACLGTLIGHCFPIFMRFQGGKGLASFGGMILAYNPRIFLVLLVSGLVMVFIANYGVVLAMYAGILFPVTVYFHSHDWGATLLSAAASGFIMFMHRDNVRRTLAGEDTPVRSWFRKEFCHKKC